MMTRTRGLRRALTAGAVGLALLTGCGGSSDGTSSSKPAVCTDVDNLQASVQKLKDVSIQKGALATIRTDVDQIKQDYATLKADAKSQYAAELAVLSSSLDTASAALAAATTSPNAATLAAVATAVQGVGDAAKAMKTAVADTC